MAELTATTIRIRERASVDIQAAFDHYVAIVRREVALRFLDSIESAFARLAEDSATGSDALGYELSIPGLRQLMIDGYPFIIFYRVSGDGVDIWRVLHAHQDVPATLRPRSI